MIDRTARTDYPVHELISRRWSPVRFEDRPVEVEKLRQVFEAARWGSSCYNEQPWRFVVGVKGHSGVHEKIVSTLVDANRQWAQHAPVLAISVAKLAFDRNGKPNRHAQHDVGLAESVCAGDGARIGGASDGWIRFAEGAAGSWDSGWVRADGGDRDWVCWWGRPLAGRGSSAGRSAAAETAAVIAGVR